MFLPFRNVTHRLDDLFIDVLVSVTLAGAAARSFDVHSGMTANVAGVGTSTARIADLRRRLRQVPNIRTSAWNTILLPRGFRATGRGGVRAEFAPADHVGGSQVRNGLVWGFSCQAVVLGFADSFLFGAGKAVLRPVACDQVRGARGRGQGTETLAELGGLPPSVACVSQRLDA